MKDEGADRIVREIVQKLKQRREELGLSLNRAAELAGITHVGLLQLERGDRTPMLRTVVKLADALQLPLEMLVKKGR